MLAPIQDPQSCSSSSAVCCFSSAVIHACAIQPKQHQTKEKRDSKELTSSIAKALHAGMRRGIRVAEEKGRKEIAEREQEVDRQRSTIWYLSGLHPMRNGLL
jgi:hypothetical protein